jgi:hypothetical protein
MWCEHDREWHPYNFKVARWRGLSPDAPDAYWQPMLLANKSGPRATAQLFGPQHAATFGDAFVM